MDREACIVHGVTELDTTEQLTLHYLCFKRSNLVFLWKINFNEARINKEKLRKRILLPLFP